MGQPFNKATFALACGIGTVLGLGSYTFDYGEGLSYFSTNPVACANCHIMNDQYDSWTKAGHHQAAVCVDCHLPHDFIPKYVAKADNGFWHSKGFTFQDFHEPIMITPSNARTLQDSRAHSFFRTPLTASASPSATCLVRSQCPRGHCVASIGRSTSGDGAPARQRRQSSSRRRCFPTGRRSPCCRSTT